MQARLLLVHPNPLQQTDLVAHLKAVWYEMELMRCVALRHHLFFSDGFLSIDIREIISAHGKFQLTKIR